MKTQKRTSGFTLIELLVGLVIVLLLGALAASALTGQTDATRQNAVQEFFVTDVRRAVSSLVLEQGGEAEITADAAGKEMLSRQGLSTQTPWGDSWSISTQGSPNEGFSIRYPIGGLTPDETGQRIADYLSADDVDGAGERFVHIESAVYNNNALTVEIGRVL